MSSADLTHLRHAIAVARRSRDKGNAPFGALLVDENGTVLLEGENILATGDCTAHAEMILVREASRRFPAGVLARCTLYSSAEPCAMCAGALFWSGIGRVVFGLSLANVFARIGHIFAPLRIPCADVLASGRRRVEVVGPLIEDEAAVVFDGYGG